MTQKNNDDLINHLFDDDDTFSEYVYKQLEKEKEKKEKAQKVSSRKRQRTS